MKAFFIALGLLLHGSLVLAADRLHDIKARGELRVCIWPEYYGISYRNPKSGAVATAAKIATPHNPAIIYKPGDGVVSSGLAYVAVRACQAVVC